MFTGETGAITVDTNERLVYTEYMANTLSNNTVSNDELAYSQVSAVLEYLEGKGFLAGSLSARLVMSVLERELEVK